MESMCFVAFALDVNVACSGIAFALDMARRYLAGGDIPVYMCCYFFNARFIRFDMLQIRKAHIIHNA